MPWLKISDDVASLPRPQQDAVTNAANAELHSINDQARAHEKGRHRAEAVGMSRRVVGTLSGAVLAGCGIAYLATTHGLIP